MRSLLVAVDLTAISDRVLRRVALLPLADGARLTLLHVVPDGLPVRQRRRAERDARKALADQAATLASSLPADVRVKPLVKVGAAARQIAACAAAAKAELIVMGRGGARALREVFLGSTAERVIRRSTLPVLVVRLPPRARHERPAIALDFDGTAHDAIAVMLRLLPPRPRVAVIHAFDIPYRGFVYSSLSEEDAKELADELAHAASRALAKLLATALEGANVPPADVPTWKVHVRYGSPRRVIERAVATLDTDLLVLGTRRYTGAAHVFLGTVAGDVLRRVPCDVLVVPPCRPGA